MSLDLPSALLREGFAMLATVGGLSWARCWRRLSGRAAAGRDPNQRSRGGLFAACVGRGGWSLGSRVVGRSSAWPSSWLARWSVCRSTCEASAVFSFLPLAAAFILVVIRCAGLFSVVPLLGLPAIPARVRMAAAVVVSVAAFFGAGAPPFAAWDHAARFIIAALSEALLGLCAGLAARLVLDAAAAADRPLACPWASAWPQPTIRCTVPSPPRYRKFFPFWRLPSPWQVAFTAKPWLGCAGQWSRCRPAHPLVSASWQRG